MLEKTNVIALASLFVLTAFTGCLGSDTDEKTTLEKLIVAYEVKEDYENPDEERKEWNDSFIIDPNTKKPFDWDTVKS